MDNLLLSNENDVFHAVWSRVSAQQAGPSPDSAPELPLHEQLAGLAVCVERLRNRYRNLSARFSHHPFSQRFVQMCKEHTTVLNRLQAVYFLLTGDTCPCPAVPPGSEPTLFPVLRTLYWEERNLHTVCQRLAAKDEPVGPAVTLCRDICSGHMAQLSTLLTSLLR